MICRAVLSACALAVVAGLCAGSGARAAGEAAKPTVRVLQIAYRAHNGARRHATVVLPAWYRKGRRPAVGGFAVVSPDGQGRRLPWHSWGYAGQIEDLARMPRILRRALPWLHVDRRRIYAFGGSMGGQESLLLLARHPRMLAGVAVFDPVTDFARQYRAFPRLPCNRVCRRRLEGRSIGTVLQSMANAEVGGNVARMPGAYARRSPSTYAKRIAASCVPLQLWWSVSDRTIRDERHQAGGLFRRVTRLNIYAPVQAFVGSWIHTRAMRARTRLPVALANFDLVPWTDPPIGLQITDPPADADQCAGVSTR